MQYQSTNRFSISFSGMGAFPGFPGAGGFPGGAPGGDAPKPESKPKQDDDGLD